MKDHSIDDNQVDRIGEKLDFFCPVNALIDVIAGKWKLRILWQLRNGIKRFGELKEALPNITPAVLSSHLQELAKQGIISREIYAEVPPRSEYSLTETGRSLFAVLYAMESWGIDFIRLSKSSATPYCFWPRP
ncbi:MAG: transcriptional regulator, HxlR family [Mucilaginibacter sp.]|nr:transcriptional regulator, HxlR family [Mucilaginibacter sp.]